MSDESLKTMPPYKDSRLSELLVYTSVATPTPYPTLTPFKPIIFRQSCSGKLKTSPDFQKQAKAKQRRKQAASRKQRRGY
jgi:hypothetical protein